ncbi:CYTH domain-containing protein [Candidatus Parcubacteria bacterium]|nr:MAG: CYTH domain-containing protein [Candidatus Parcubacteria bacterium]
MIEVEKKFLLTDAEKERLLEGAEFLGEKTFEDVYYDTKDYDLSSRDKWLRSRDGVFHLKISARNAVKRQISEYHELETEEDIRKELGVQKKKSLKEDIELNGFVPFARFITTRKKYKRGDFAIDLDAADFGYQVGEIELLVPDETGRDAAVEKIFAFARSIGLPIVPVSGKVIEYIRRKNPKHYEALIASGTLNWLGSRE